MKALEVATSANRNSGFWVAGLMALFLSVLSWMNRIVVSTFNHYLFQVGRLDDPGWWLYLAFRLSVVSFLLWTIVRFPSTVDNTVKSALTDTEKRFFDPLMGLRAFACLMVLMGHYFFVAFPFSREGVSRYVTTLLQSSPWAGVWIFFTLSGYLMGKGFARGRYTLDEAGSRLFLRNRILRIAPIYYSAVLLVSIYRYPEIFQLRHLWMLIEILIFDFRGDLPINSIGALWSVSTEVQFYLLVPLLMVGLLRLSKLTGRAFPLVPLILVCAATAGRMHIATLPGMMYTYGYAPLIPNLDLFIAGMSLNLFPTLKMKSSHRRAWIPPLLVLVTGGFYVAICGLRVKLHMRMEDFWARGPVFCVIFATVYICLSETYGVIAIARNAIGLSLSGLQWIGTLTYCLYVFHPDVFVSSSVLLPPHHSLQLSLKYFPLVILETLAVAIFFYFAVEKPFDLKKRVSGTPLIDSP